ncbi:MAG: hypothetical protein EPO23_03160 [Xanthobacteraceae bacterium]|nr:MAG: hypothetical protein EPO23_03160 [Xanthobacteraceae bacterium]
MDKLTFLTAANKGLRAVSFVLFFKSIVGFSVAVLALVGFTVPLLGYEPTPIAEGSAAVGGALLGAFLALRS